MTCPRSARKQQPGYQARFVRFLYIMEMGKEGCKIGGWKVTCIKVRQYTEMAGWLMNAGKMGEQVKVRWVDGWMDG